MTTLDEAPVAPLLRRLFSEAEAPDGPEVDSLSGEQWDRLVQSKSEYPRLYGMMKELWLPVSRDTGSLLYMLVRATGASNIVELGTSFGISTLHIAAALRDNGGGILITSELEPTKVDRARRHLKEGGLEDLVEFRVGDALQTLTSGLRRSIDFVLLDGAKPLYPDILDLVTPHLRPGALIIADNADLCADYLDRVRAPHGGFLSVPFSDDVELSMRTQ